MRLVRNCTPALALCLSPTSLNLSFSSKSPKLLVIHRNSLRGTVLSSEPPTIAPSSMRQVSLSPSQPASDLPSNSLVGSATELDTRQKNATPTHIRIRMGSSARECCCFAWFWYG